MYVLTLLVFLVDFKKTTLDFVEFEMSNIIRTSLFIMKNSIQLICIVIFGLEFDTISSNHKIGT